MEEQEPEPQSIQKPTFIDMRRPKLHRQLIPLCKCLIEGESSESIVIPERKKFVLSAVHRTEEYMREHRIPEFIAYLMCKVMASNHASPATYCAELLDDCMLFRAGFAEPPVVYEDRHLEAVIKSFDPGNRGWMSAGQVRRAFNLLGLPPVDLGEPVPNETVMNFLRETQIRELHKLLCAGVRTPRCKEGPENSELTSATSVVRSDLGTPTTTN